MSRAFLRLTALLLIPALLCDLVIAQVPGRLQVPACTPFHSARSPALFGAQALSPLLGSTHLDIPGMHVVSRMDRLVSGLVGASSIGTDEIWPILRREAQVRIDMVKSIFQAFGWTNVILQWKSARQPTDEATIRDALAYQDDLGFPISFPTERVHFIDPNDPFVQFQSKTDSEREAGALILLHGGDYHILLPRALAAILSDRTHPKYRQAQARFLHERMEIFCLEQSMPPREAHFQASRLEQAYLTKGDDEATFIIEELTNPERIARIELDFPQMLRNIFEHRVLSMDRVGEMSDEDWNWALHAFIHLLRRFYPASPAYYDGFSALIYNAFSEQNRAYYQQRFERPLDWTDLVLLLERLHTAYESPADAKDIVAYMQLMPTALLHSRPQLSKAQIYRFLMMMGLDHPAVWNVRGIPIPVMQAAQTLLTAHVVMAELSQPEIERCPPAEQRQIADQVRTVLNRDLRVLPHLLDAAAASGIVVEQFLAHGLDGWTFRGRVDNTPVAVKFTVLGDASMTPPEHQFLFNELDLRLTGRFAAQRLAHAAITPQDPSDPYYEMEVFEWVRGLSLQDILMKRDLFLATPMQVVLLMAELMESVQNLMEAPVIEQDLRGLRRNVLRPNEGPLRWIDRGQMQPWPVDSPHLPSLKIDLKKRVLMTALNVLNERPVLDDVESEGLWSSDAMRDVDHGLMEHMLGPDKTLAVPILLLMDQAWRDANFTLDVVADRLREECRMALEPVSLLRTDGLVGAQTQERESDSLQDLDAALKSFVAMISHRARILRTRKGISAKALGEQISVTEQTIWNLERGVGAPRLSLLLQYILASVMGVSQPTVSAVIRRLKEQNISPSYVFGKDDIDTRSLFKIARSLKTNVPYLLRIDDTFVHEEALRLERLKDPDRLRPTTDLKQEKERYLIQFGRRTEMLRRARGLSQDALGEVVGISQAAVSYIENAQKWSTFSNALYLSMFFEINVETYFDLALDLSDDDIPDFKLLTYPEACERVLTSIKGTGLSGYVLARFIGITQPGVHSALQRLARGEDLSLETVFALLWASSKTMRQALLPQSA